MILDHNKIIKSVQDASIIFEPFDESQVQGASLDLRIGPQGATTTHGKIVKIDMEGFMVLEPGDMAIISSLEILTFDASHVGRIGLRSKYARKGLHVTTGLQVDPGFSGRLFVGVTNLTPQPVTLPYKDDFISIEIHKLNEPTAKPYSGPYQNKVDLGPEDIEHIVDGKSYALSEVITSLQSLSANVGKLTTDYDVLASQQKFFRWALPTGFGVIATMIAVVALIIALK